MEDGNEVITKSSGDIFVDLGLKNPEQLLAKSTLARAIREIINRRGLTQAKAAKLLGTHQTQISRLNSGEGISVISIDILMIWLTKLDRDVTLTIKKTKNQGCGRIQVVV